MKKIRIFSLVLLMVSTAIFVGYRTYKNATQDVTPPVISCKSDILEVSVQTPEEEFLADVKAMDETDGDVSDQLVIEKMSSFTEEGTRIITYAAVDEHLNVGTLDRTLVYTDYKPPVFSLKRPLSFATGSTIDVLSCVSANSSLDGSLDERVKYSLEETIITTESGEYPIAFRVMDSAGNQVYLDTVIEIYDRNYSDLDVLLKEYLVYVKKGSSFQPDKYFQGARRAHVYGEQEMLTLQSSQLEIRSDVNTDEKGTYCVDYFVNYDGSLGKSRLIVVVQ